MNNEDKIVKALENLQAGQERIEITQHEQGRAIQAQGTAIAQIKTGVEAVTAGQQDLQKQVKTIRSEMATRADIQDVDAKLVKRVNNHEKRIDDLEKEAGLPNPHKI